MTLLETPTATIPVTDVKTVPPRIGAEISNIRLTVTPIAWCAA
ncbi:hypothetical protein P775_00505 [Puniceibacterium antarcticum]|uniref:Uncharacterized protein n=1 Tax=Puniceibacterium antarcticum TaxID=1206336 RepID=A0A2G8RKW1_9RHOB|nr:hypothetical protein [Puniceibacterium antarcticum]PIL22197.1 hypothetical protein P775_00505 [Puniceibacterium antarcticum]